jgi:hypothetical protein
MATVNWDYWLEELMIAVNGAERELLNHQTRAAAIEFCNLSEAWRLDNLPIDIEQGKRAYVIEPPLSDTEIHKIVEVSIEGRKINPTSWAQVIDSSPSNLNFEGTARCYVSEYTDKIEVHPIPNADITNGLVCKSAIRPTRIAEGMNAEVGKRYFDAILNGAKARLYLIPNKPWSDGAAAMLHKKLMTDAAASARREVNTGHGRVALRTTLHLIGGR